MTLDEAEYQAHVSQLAEVLAQSHIQGVYEERLALDWKAALQLGCTAVVAPQAHGRPLAEGFAPTELQASFMPLAAPSDVWLAILCEAQKCPAPALLHCQ